ncbi:transglycosylase SLT domain-containing protein [Alkaliphilus pronyensis]|uniref:Transglycosylase SLT domain-containing protein n=1 Tax=Alkaliphilus pronyensis TaxID=1482732 RepID=A0A6I0EYR9_9FIRM|nr:S-layer homology domain-containing protein [Alkaliphilus pronyensis]KAB3534788.1 transglycosylase SLT domain-containing protein [Alkaliphilus pronyensis]
MLKKRLIIFISVIMLLLSSQITEGFSNENLSYEEVEKIIEEVAKEKNIPSVILKAIAWKESNYRQFDENGQPLIVAGNTGIMQVNKVHKHLDQDKLKHNIKYNIEAGADILLGRWNATGTVYPTIGDMNPNVLEHWYFPLWGYNSWVSKNNPNVSGKKAYQEEIFQLIREKYQQPITSIDAGLLPCKGLPKGSLKLPTPEIHHFGDLNEDHKAVFKDTIGHPKKQYIEALYEMGIVKGVGNDTFKPDEYITKEQAVKIIIDALKIELRKERAVSNDWQDVSQWAVGYMTTAHEKSLIATDDNNNINPKEAIMREEAIGMLVNGIGKEFNEKEPLAIPIKYKDSQQLCPKRVKATAYLIALGVLEDEENKELRPKDFITRGELCELVVKLMERKNL